MHKILMFFLASSFFLLVLFCNKMPASESIKTVNPSLPPSTLDAAFIGKWYEVTNLKTLLVEFHDSVNTSFGTFVRNISTELNKTHPVMLIENNGNYIIFEVPFPGILLQYTADPNLTEQAAIQAYQTTRSIPVVGLKLQKENLSVFEGRWRPRPGNTTVLHTFNTNSGEMLEANGTVVMEFIYPHTQLGTDTWLSIDKSSGHFRMVELRGDKIFASDPMTTPQEALESTQISTLIYERYIPNPVQKDDVRALKPGFYGEWFDPDDPSKITAHISSSTGMISQSQEYDGYSFIKDLSGTTFGVLMGLFEKNGDYIVLYAYYSKLYTIAQGANLEQVINDSKKTHVLMTVGQRKSLKRYPSSQGASSGADKADDPSSQGASSGADKADDPLAKGRKQLANTLYFENPKYKGKTMWLLSSEQVDPIVNQEMERRRLAKRQHERGERALTGEEREQLKALTKDSPIKQLERQHNARYYTQIWYMRSDEYSKLCLTEDQVRRIIYSGLQQNQAEDKIQKRIKTAHDKAYAEVKAKEDEESEGRQMKRLAQYSVMGRR